MTTHGQSSDFDFDFDRIVVAWLADGPTEVADRVLDAAFREVHRTRQRRRVPASWRNTMPVLRLITAGRALTAILVVLVVGGALYLLAPHPGVGPTASSSSASPGAPSPSPSSTATSATAAPSAPGSTPAPTSDQARIPHGPLAAGAYTTTVFAPATTFSVPSGWLNQSEVSDLMLLRFGDNAHQVSLARVVGDPLKLARTNADYTLGKPVAIRVAGLDAQETSVSLAAAAAPASFYPLAPVADAAAEGADRTLDLNLPGTQARVITVTVGDQQFVILVQRPIAGDQNGFDQAAQALIDSITFP